MPKTADQVADELLEMAGPLADTPEAKSVLRILLMTAITAGRVLQQDKVNAEAAHA